MMIGENLRLVRPLARGGMGSVWVAHHLGLQSRVAVKFPDDAMGATQGFLARFAREAAAVAKMRSPHVVQILDYGTLDGGVPYIVMELLEGESLGQRIERLGLISVPEVASVIQQTCRALTRAHSLGIIHRDIKPDNIFITDADGELFVKVLDFGIAKVETVEATELTSTGTTVGTPSYASPEQLMSAKTATASTDLWAVAATAYRALTGRLPFTGETFAALCVAITRGAFTPPSEIRPGLPPSLDAWFARSLDVAVERRFPSARELVEQFVVAAGLSGGSLSVLSALPPRADSDPPEGSAERNSGSPSLSETVAVPGVEDLRQARGTAESSRRRAADAGPSEPFGGSGTGVSIGGASISAGEKPERRSLGKMVVIVAAALLLLIGAALFVITRTGASLSAPPQAASGAGNPEPGKSRAPAPPQEVPLRRSEPQIMPQETETGPAPRASAEPEELSGAAGLGRPLHPPSPRRPVPPRTSSRPPSSGGGAARPQGSAGAPGKAEDYGF